MLEWLSGRKGSVSSVNLAAENAALRAEVTGLRSLVGELRSENGRLQARISELEGQVRTLTAKLSINSRNSSKPPSSDGPAAAPRDRKKGRRKRGAQPGHEGTTRAMVPVEQVDEVVDCRPTCCQGCGALLLGEDPVPERRQLIDIPKPRVIVYEYRRHRLVCLACVSHNFGQPDLVVTEATAFPDGPPCPRL
jgi:transposase